MRRRPVLPIALVVGLVVVVGIVVAAAIFLGRHSSDLDQEDPLVLYQVAKELHQQGDDDSALKTLERARQMTDHERAVREINELADKIRSGREVQAGKQQPTRVAVTSTPDAAPAPETQGDAAPQKEAESRYTIVRVPARAQPRVVRNSSRARRARVARAERVGWVQVESTERARISVDGVPVRAFTPARLDLEPGSHSIEVASVSDPARSSIRRVRVRSDRTTHVRIAFAKPPDVPRLVTPVRAAIGTVGHSERKAAVGLVGVSGSAGEGPSADNKERAAVGLIGVSGPPEVPATSKK